MLHSKLSAVFHVKHHRLLHPRGSPALKPLELKYPGNFIKGSGVTNGDHGIKFPANQLAVAHIEGWLTRPRDGLLPVTSLMDTCCQCRSSHLR